MILLQIFLMGFIILVGAILLNGIASMLGLQTWYSFLEEKTISVLDGFWLFVIYPLALGALGYVAAKIFSLH